MYLKRFTDSDNREDQNDDENLLSESLSGFPETNDDDDFPDIPIDENYDIEKLQAEYPDENEQTGDKDDKEKKYQKMMDEFKSKEAREKEQKRWEDFNYMKVEEIDRDNPDIDNFVSNVLVPGLLEFTRSNKYHYSLIRLFHRLGCSASFVFALAGVFHDVAHALQMAVESSEDKIVWAFEDDVAKAERVIVCYRKMFHKFDKTTVFAFNKDDKWREHHEPLNFISFISPFNFQRTYEE